MQSSASGIAPTIDITGSKNGIAMTTSVNDKVTENRSKTRFHVKAMIKIKKRKICYDENRPLYWYYIFFAILKHVLF